MSDDDWAKPKPAEWWRTIGWTNGHDQLVNDEDKLMRNDEQVVMAS